MDSQILFNHQRDELLSKLEHDEKALQLGSRLHVFEIDHSGDVPAPYEKTEIPVADLGTLFNKEHEEPSDTSHTTIKSRSILILGPALGRSYRSSTFEDGDCYPSNILPFHKKKFGELCDELQLPKATPWLLKSNSAHFQKYHISGEEDSESALGFTMRLASRGVFKIDISASISYHPSTGAVNLFLHGCSSEQQRGIASQLREKPSVLARHPLFVPLILVEMKTDIIEQQEVRLWNQLVDVETLSQQTGAPAVDKSEKWRTSGQSKYRNLRNMSADTLLQFITIGVLEVIQLTTSGESHAKSLLLCIEAMQNSIDAVNESTNSPRKLTIAKAGAIISEKLDLLEHRTRVIMADIQFVEKRAQAQQSAVYNYIARLDARAQKDLAHFSSLIAQASKRDSSAMKGIAVLTMVFLPGTYIATFFAMPIMDFPAEAHLPSVKHAFWLYWAISIPLTVVVLIAYGAFQVHVERNHRKQDQELQTAAAINIDHFSKRA